MNGNPAVAPVAIGGVGGSGTRMVAQIVSHLGRYLGDDLNAASDNLWFTLLLKRPELLGGRQTDTEFERAIHVFAAAMSGASPLTADEIAWVQGLAAEDRMQHGVAWLRQRVASLTRAASQPRRPGPWGWKEPNTHMFIDRFAGAFPGLKYIHVMRNGLDMAHSTNQNQVRLWGPLILGRQDIDTASPRVSLEFWCRVNRRAISFGETMGGRFLLLNYDEFCAAPLENLRTLIGFLGSRVHADDELALLSLIRCPQSIGRFKLHGVEMFDADDVAYVRSLGFDTRVPRNAARADGTSPRSEPSAMLDREDRMTCQRVGSV